MSKSSHNNNQTQQYLKQQHKISKPRKIRQNKNNNVVITHTTNANQHPPPIYYVDKTGFKQLVQKLTGFNPNSSSSPVQQEQQQPRRKKSSKLELNRPPPLSQIRPILLPASPVSPLTVLQEEPDSPITAYMKYLGEYMMVGDDPVPDNNSNSADQQPLQLQEGSKDAIDANDPKIVSGPDLPVQSDFVSSDGMQFSVEDMSFVDHVSAYAPEAIAYHNYPDEQNGFLLEPLLGNNNIGIFDSSSSSILAVGQEKIKTQEEELKSLEEMPGSSFRDPV